MNVHLLAWVVLQRAVASVIMIVMLTCALLDRSWLLVCTVEELLDRATQDGTAAGDEVVRRIAKLKEVADVLTNLHSMSASSYESQLADAITRLRARAAPSSGVDAAAMAGGGDAPPASTSPAPSASASPPVSAPVAPPVAPPVAAPPTPRGLVRPAGPRVMLSPRPTLGSAPPAAEAAAGPSPSGGSTPVAPPMTSPAGRGGPGPRGLVAARGLIAARPAAATRDTRLQQTGGGASGAVAAVEEFRLTVPQAYARKLNLTDRKQTEHVRVSASCLLPLASCLLPLTRTLIKPAHRRAFGASYCPLSRGLSATGRRRCSWKRS